MSKLHHLFVAIGFCMSFVVSSHHSSGVRAIFLLFFPCSIQGLTKCDCELRLRRKSALPPFGIAFHCYTHYICSRLSGRQSGEGDVHHQMTITGRLKKNEEYRKKSAMGIVIFQISNLCTLLIRLHANEASQILFFLSQSRTKCTNLVHLPSQPL